MFRSTSILSSALVLSLALLLYWGGLVPQIQQIQALTHASGVYTNLCGTGTAATAHTCNSGCDINSGSCSGSGTTVVRYICDGRQTECRQNESSFATFQSVSGVGCGKTVQIDVFNKTCRNSNGSWSCGSGDLKDYIVWYSGDCSGSNPAPTPSPTPTSSSQSCRNIRPVNAKFRLNDESWVYGYDITSRKVMPGTQVDVTCFAKTSNGQLTNGIIDVTNPNGSTYRLANQAQFDNFTLAEPGTYTFKCSSTSIAACGDTDTITVKSLPSSSSPTPRVTPTPTPRVSPTPKASPTPKTELHKSRCEDLVVAGGNNSQVPAKVTLRAKASDNKGSIQKYKFYFGDGTQLESDQPEVQHTYESSGSFVARVDVKDSQGNWRSDSACETKVTVKPSSLESHKANCSDIHITADNGGRAPSNVKFKVTGYDNKDAIKGYKLDFGNGVVKEQDGQVFENRYETAGTYTVRAYVKDSQNNWRGGEQGCKRSVYISTEPLTKQPDTGTPTLFSLLGLGSGIGGVATLALKKMKYVTAATRST